MRRLRDDDVHRGVVDATALPKFVDAARRLGGRFPWLFNSPSDAQVEAENPDRSKVRSSVLTSEMTLYIYYSGERIEAATAGKRFIELMRDLVGYVRKRRGP